MKLRFAKLLALPLLLLSACSGFPHIFSGNEVPPEVITAPRPVMRPAPAADATYPRLGDVPSKPTDFPSDSAIAEDKNNLQQGRTEGKALHRQHDAQTEAP